LSFNTRMCLTAILGWVAGMGTSYLVAQTGVHMAIEVPYTILIGLTTGICITLIIVLSILRT